MSWLRHRRSASLPVALLALGLALAAVAQAGDAVGPDLHDGDVAAVLAAVTEHPGLRAATAAAEAAALRLGAVRSPLTLNLDVNVQRLQVEAASVPGSFTIDDASERATLTALLRPFVAGELVDLLDQRRLDVERAELSLRETRANLEAQALRAAAGVLLAERGLALARDGAGLSERALVATRTRHVSGAASDLELRRSEIQLTDAERSVERAERQLAAAEAGLRQLAGDARLRDVPTLEPVLGTPPDLIRAALDVALAEVGARNQARGLLPTVQAGYTWLGDDGDSLTLGIESRTLQPSVSYTTESGAGPDGPNGIPDGAPPGSVPRVRGSLTVGIAWSVSPQAFLESEASDRQLEAAAAGLAAAHDRAELQRRSDRDAVASASAALELAELERALAVDDAAAAAARYEAGLIGSLERDQSVLALAQAELGWWAARVDLLDTILDTYVAYAIPISEVRP